MYIRIIIPCKIAGRESSVGVAARGLVNGRDPRRKRGRDLPVRTFTTSISKGYFADSQKSLHNSRLGQLLSAAEEGGSKVRLALFLFVLLIESGSKYSILKEE